MDNDATAIGETIRSLHSPGLQRALERIESGDVGHGQAADHAAIEAARQAEAEYAAVVAFDTRFPIRYRDATTDRPDVLAWVAEFTADPGHARSLLLLGPTGTGKTHQAYGAIRAAASTPMKTRSGLWRTPRWIATTYADLTASMRPRGRDYDTEEKLREYRDTELLFIDDLGAGKPTEFTEEVTYRLINGRYEDMRPGIFTSNLALADLRDAIGDRIASRIAESAVRVVLDGPDRRRQPGAANARTPRTGVRLEDPPNPHAAWWNN